MLKQAIKNKIPNKYLNQLTSIWLLFRHPKTELPFFLNDLKQDFLTLTDQIKYDTNFILICGLPKSGTTWVEHIFSQVPGFIQQNKSALRGLSGMEKLTDLHDLNEEMLNSHPKNRYTFLKTHTHFSERNVDLIHKSGLMPIVVIRDIRDVMISRYHHIMSENQHWMHEHIAHLDSQEGFKKSLHFKGPNQEAPVHYYINWIRNWLNYAESNQNIFILCYEELKKSPVETTKRMLDFQGIHFEIEEIEKILHKQKSLQQEHSKSSLKSNLGKKGRSLSTLRKGTVGGWKDFLENEMNHYFKREAADIINFIHSRTV